MDPLTIVTESPTLALLGSESFRFLLTSGSRHPTSLFAITLATIISNSGIKNSNGGTNNVKILSNNDN